MNVSHFVVVIIVYALAQIVADAGDLRQCPQHLDKNLFLRVYKDKCYQFNLTKKMQWTEAESYCTDHGGKLITIETRDKQEFIEQMLKNVTLAGSRLWIGATDREKEQDWKWVTGTNMSIYSNWKKGSPSCEMMESHCREDCACLLLEEEFKWYPTFCQGIDFQYGFICQYDMDPNSARSTTTSIRPPIALPLVGRMDGDDSSVEDTGPIGDDVTHSSAEQMTLSTISAIGAETTERCPKHIDRNLLLRTHNQTCYQFIFTELKNWEDAKIHCEKQDGNLITIEHKETQDFVQLTLTNVPWAEKLWIGARNTDAEQHWIWVTGKNMSTGYKKWKEGSPSCPFPLKAHCRENCACLLIEDNFKWHQTFCSGNECKYPSTHFL